MHTVCGSLTARRILCMRLVTDLDHCCMLQPGAIYHNVCNPCLWAQWLDDLACLRAYMIAVP
jgi:hypothetical protein